jgi:hypothetical protein
MPVYPGALRVADHPPRESAAIPRTPFQVSRSRLRRTLRVGTAKAASTAELSCPGRRSIVASSRASTIVTNSTAESPKNAMSKYQNTIQTPYTLRRFMSRYRVVAWVRSHRRPAQPHVVQGKDGKTGSRRALLARAGSCRDRRGRSVLQEPVLAEADGERRNRPGVRGILFEIPEASMSAVAAMRAHPAPLAHRRSNASEIKSIMIRANRK